MNSPCICPNCRLFRVLKPGLALPHALVAMRQKDRIGAPAATTLDDMELLDARISSLTGQVNAQLNDPTVILDWTDFAVRWKTFFSQNTSTLDQVFPNLPQSSFAPYVAEFNQRLAALKALGVTTDVTPFSPGDPVKVIGAAVSSAVSTGLSAALVAGALLLLLLAVRR